MTSVADQISAARSRIENLSPDEFAARLGDATVVDLREAHELEATGTIPGAIHIPRGMLEFNADSATPYYNEALKPDKPVLLYCASGGRSALAGAALKDLGYESVAHLDGGFNGWTKAGKETAQHKG